MRRRRKPGSAGNSLGWMVTFADLMTLLFSFFLLILSMSSLDRTMVKLATSRMFEVSGLMPKHGAGRIPTQFQVVADALENPIIVYKEPKRIQDVLFPDEVLPANMTRGDLDENLQVLLRPEGVALVLSDGLLFSAGKSELDENSKRLLGQFAAFLATVSTQVNIAGYTDSTASERVDNLALSSARALAVLRYFLDFGLDPERFSASGYAEAFPLADNSLPEGRAKNRRVEILLKTSGQTYL